MRKFYKICALLSPIMIIIISLIVLVIFTGAVNDPTKIPTYNWNLIGWLLPTTCLFLLITGLINWNVTLDKDVWKSIEELNTEKELLKKERNEILEIRNKLVRALLKAEDKIHE